MSQVAAWKTDGDPSGALRRLLAGLIEKGVVEAVLVPARQAHGDVVMQTLVSDPAQMQRADPLAPVVWANAGTLAASLTFKPTGAPVAAVMRSCEVRAFVELTKLNQGSRDDLLLIGVDCFGRFENKDFLALAKEQPDLGASFLAHAGSGATGTYRAGVDITNACKACVSPVAPCVDVRVCLIGADPSRELWLEATSPRGVAALEALGLTPAEEAMAGREDAIRTLEQRRQAFRDELHAAFRARTADAQGLIEATAACINCYNCRVACPVCYCRACVFTTDLFRHDSAKYLQWSRKKGMLKMPTDTVFYHLTRMVHMSTLCVGCGQCSSACPNGVPVMELFCTVAHDTQKRFSYVPGRDFAEEQPMATFHESELDDATGTGK